MIQAVVVNSTNRLYRAADGHAWVGENWYGRWPGHAVLYAQLPNLNDSRWNKGRPYVQDKEFLTLCSFPPKGLGVCVEREERKPISRYPNHPPFQGCQAWMCLDTFEWKSVHLIPIYTRLDELTAIAQSRRYASDGIFSATLGGCDIDFMSTEEKQERHSLLLQLPTSSEDRVAARKRIQARIAARKSSKPVSQSHAFVCNSAFQTNCA